jgi:hypothetical protein
MLEGQTVLAAAAMGERRAGAKQWNWRSHKPKPAGQHGESGNTCSNSSSSSSSRKKKQLAAATH